MRNLNLQDHIVVTNNLCEGTVVLEGMTGTVIGIENGDTALSYKIHIPKTKVPFFWVDREGNCMGGMVLFTVEPLNT